MVASVFRFFASYPWLFLLLTPLLLIPSPVSPFVALLVFVPLVIWGLLSCRGEAARFRDWPLALLLMAGALSVVVSPQGEESLARLYVLIAGLALYFAAERAATSERGLLSGVTVLAIGGAGIALLGLLNTGWLGGKLPALAPLYSLLGRLRIEALVLAEGTFHPNQVGGTLALVLPPVVGLLAAALVQARESSKADAPRRSRWWPPLIAAIASVATALMALSLALTLSRWGAASLVVGLLVLACAVRFLPPYLLVLPVLGVGVLLRFGDSLQILQSNRQWLSFAARQEVWVNAWNVVREFPYTGVGLGQFAAASRASYPYQLWAGGAPMGHAHNIFLDSAAGLGLPGGLAFAAFAVGVLVFGWRACIGARNRGVALLGAGLLGGLASYFFFGLIDAVPFDAKQGLFFWAVAGLLAGWGRGRVEGVRGRFRHLPGRAWWMALIAAALVVAFWFGVVVRPLPVLASFYGNLGSVQLLKAVFQQERGPQGMDDLLAKAEGAFREAAALDPGEPAFRKRLGMVLLMQGRQAESEEIWRGTPGVAKELAEWPVFRRTGSLDEELERYRLLLRLDSRLVSAYFRMGQVLSAKGDWRGAVSQYEEALALEPFSAEARVELAWALYLTGGDVSRATRLLEEVVRDAPTQSLWAHLRLGDIYKGVGESDKAVLWYSRAGERFPSSDWPPNRLGLLYAERGDTERGIAELKRALELNPNNMSSHYWLGQVYYRIGQYELAVGQLRRAVELTRNTRNPAELAGLYVSLGDVYLAAGQREAALDAWRQALAVDPGNSEAGAKLAEAEGSG